jgi:hypothetical protein
MDHVTTAAGDRRSATQPSPARQIGGTSQPGSRQPAGSGGAGASMETCCRCTDRAPRVEVPVAVRWKCHSRSVPSPPGGMRNPRNADSTRALDPARSRLMSNAGTVDESSTVSRASWSAVAAARSARPRASAADDRASSSAASRGPNTAVAAVSARNRRAKGRMNPRCGTMGFDGGPFTVPARWGGGRS